MDAPISRSERQNLLPHTLEPELPTAEAAVTNRPDAVDPVRVGAP